MSDEAGWPTPVLQSAARAFARRDGKALKTLTPPDESDDREHGAFMLLAAGGALDEGDLATARRLGARALRLGVDPRMLCMAWLASAEEDIVRAGATDADARRARAGRWRKAVLARVEAGELAAAPSARATAASEVARLRDEVVRQRALIEQLRGHGRSPRGGLVGDARDHALITRILAERLTYLSASKLASLARTCRALEEQHIAGMFLEAGCALGGSAILIASLKGAQRPLGVYDVFGMIPPPSEQDTPDVHERYRTIVEGRSKGIGGDRYYGYETDLLTRVRQNFESFGIDPAQQRVAFVQGMVQDTLVDLGPVALAHLDLDWYEPVTVCLERIWPVLSVGGSIIVDDYRDWGGCRLAVDRFLGLLGRGFVADDSAGSLKITKVAV